MYNQEIKFEHLFRYRYPLLLTLFLCLVLCNINFSSIHAWSKIIPNNHPSMQIGQEREIRRDEWVVNLPWQMSQDYNQYKSRSTIMGSSGINTIIAQYQAAYNLENIGKPANWGFLLLGKSRGLSWYWSAKIILLFISSLEFLYLLTQNKKLSAFGAFLITYSPAIQWWFSNYIPELITAAQFIIISFYYLIHANKLKLKLAFTIPLMVFSTGFIFTLYPAWQIPLFYLIGSFIIYYLITSKTNKYDWILLSLVILIMTGLVVNFIIFSANDLHTLLNTTYPGHRISSSGEVIPTTLFNYFFNVTTPFQTPSFSNACELSSFWTLFPFFPVICLIIPKQCRSTTFNIILYLNIFFIIWMLVPYFSNEYLLKYSLLSFVPGSRLIIIFGLLNTYLIIMTINVFMQYKRQIHSYKIVLVNFVCWTFVAISLFTNNLYNIDIYVASILFGVLVFSCFAIFFKTKYFVYIMMFLTFISGCIINPLVFGVNDLYGSDLSKIVQKINNKDKQTWIAIYNWKTAQFLVANGIRTFNSVQMYPNLTEMAKVDQHKEYIDIYNRYASIATLLQLESESTAFTQAGADGFVMKLNCNDLHKFNIKYILSSIVLSNDYSYCKLRPLYSIDGYYIYGTE